MIDLSTKQTILLVDDAKENIRILAEVLREDYTIKVATNGEKALDIAMSENPPDLILLDIVMPRIDGYEVCKRLKASPQTKDIPVIFITGKVSEEDEILGFNLGAVDYIIKPFRPIVVKARVKTHSDLKRYRDYLEGISYRDGLTGIFNRRKFDEYLHTTWEFVQREKLPISLIMIDIDRFKLFNDNYGHQAGDKCLINVAQTLSNSVLRKTDLVARYGGEEFVCVLPSTVVENALDIAENLRKNIIELQIPHEFSMVENYLTISVGVASIIPDANSKCSDLIKAADDALYISKEGGRNRVSCCIDKNI